MRREYERVTCPSCGRSVSAYVPHRGDGSGLRVVPHAIVDPAKVRTNTVLCGVGGRIIIRERGACQVEH